MVEQKPESSTLKSFYSNIFPQEEMLEVGRKKKKLTIGILSEQQKYERRIILTPEAVKILVENGHDVLIEKQAGEGANYSDREYSENGATIVDTKTLIYSAEIILKVSPPKIEEIENFSGNQLLFSFLNMYTQSEEYLRKLMDKKITAIALEYIKDEFNFFPVQQSMQAISGYAAIILAGDLLSNTHGGKGIMLGSIAGITPTEVIIIGAGTTAEFAARSALGFGATVKVFDNSPQRLTILQKNLGQQIYTSVFHPQVLIRALKSADVLIGAYDFHDEGPKYFISEEMVKEMKKGSVIIDTTTAQGGCIETTELRGLDDPLYIKHNIIHYTAANLPSIVPRTSSMALSNIILPVLIDIGFYGGIKPYLKVNHGLRNGVYLYNGILTNERLGSNFNIPSKNLDLLMAAF